MEEQTMGPVCMLWQDSFLVSDPTKLRGAPKTLHVTFSLSSSSSETQEKKDINFSCGFKFFTRKSFINELPPYTRMTNQVKTADLHLEDYGILIQLSHAKNWIAINTKANSINLKTHPEFALIAGEKYVCSVWSTTTTTIKQQVVVTSILLHGNVLLEEGFKGIDDISRTIGSLAIDAKKPLKTRDDVLQEMQVAIMKKSSFRQQKYNGKHRVAIKLLLQQELLAIEKTLSTVPDTVGEMNKLVDMVTRFNELRSKHPNIKLGSLDREIPGKIQTLVTLLKQVYPEDK